MEIIRGLMQDDGSANDLLHMESSGQNRHAGSAEVPQQGRKIPGMVGMPGFPWVEMAAGIPERFPTAVSTLVDVESEEPRFGFGQPGHRRLHQHAVLPLSKCNRAPNLWVFPAAAKMGNGISCSLHMIPLVSLCGEGQMIDTTS